MKCQKCGAEVAEDAKFCKECGAPTSENEEGSLEFIIAQNEKAIFPDVMGVKILFIKEGGLLYSIDTEGNKCLVERNAEQDFVTDYGGAFISYGDFADDFVAKGTKTIADRSCSVYEYKYEFVGYSYTCSYAIDKSTGICMEVKYGADSQGVSASFSWVVTEIKIGNVNLDEYINLPEGIDYTQE